ncbi:hypothetical protein BH09PAT3_BH09PAT3_5110 [soil metagenome]
MSKKQCIYISIALLALAAGIILTLVFTNTTVRLTMTTDGCSPDPLVLSSATRTIQVVNNSQRGDFIILDNSGSAVVTSSDMYNGTVRDVPVHLKTGYYTIQCGSDQYQTQLTVGTPDTQNVDLGSTEASKSVLNSAGNNYVVTNLVANKARYNPEIVDPTLLDAWGLASRPAGADGHFWVASNRAGTSLEYVGDVGDTPLYQNDLRTVSIPGAAADSSLPADASDLGTPTGIVFNPFQDRFIVDQGAVKGPAKFIFAGQDGTISAWTEQTTNNGTVNRLGWATRVADASENGEQYFGIAISPKGDKILTADFGYHPAIRSFDTSFKPIQTAGFANPFTKDNENPAVNDWAPWNVTTLGDKVYVAYVQVGQETDDVGMVPAIGEENHAVGSGRIVEYDNDGKLIKILQDKSSLNAPWGVAIAPAGFGRFTGELLVANFGDGTISAFKKNGSFDDWLRDDKGRVIVVPGIWALVPGNGGTLGSGNSMYFTAGPNGERDGVFGKINLR